MAVGRRDTHNLNLIDTLGVFAEFISSKYLAILSGLFQLVLSLVTTRVLANPAPFLTFLPWAPPLTDGKR